MKQPYLEPITPTMSDPTRQAAFLQMMQDHKKLIYKISAMYCADAEDRQDLIQEITIQLWKALPGYNPQYRQSTWLYRVALNTAISFYRKSNRRQEVVTSLGQDIINLADEPADDADEENLSQLRGFIQQLNELNKALMILYLDGNSYREIAAVLGISETNVATKISRIKQQLKKKFTTSNITT